MAHGVTPEPPPGSEHYREGWRNGYEQASVVWSRDDAELDRLRAVAQAAHDLLDAAGTHLDRILPISTALLRARLGDAGMSDLPPTSDDDTAVTA